jgi:hypothetical protein
VQLVIRRLAVPPLALAPADPRVRLFDQLVKSTESWVRVAVEYLLESSVAIFEGQYLTGALLTPAVSVREHEPALRLTEPRPPVPRSYPRELLCYHGAGDVVEPLIYVDVLIVEEWWLHRACAFSVEVQKERDFTTHCSRAAKKSFYYMSFM